MIAITCYGAARQVTGSCHLLECAGRRVLIDCGLFQGSDAVERAMRRTSASIPHRSTSFCSPMRTSITVDAFRCWSSADSAAK